jgi:type I thyroxine 5'-deiodinase
MGTPERSLLIETPLLFEERRALAEQCAAEMQLGFPMLIDGMDDAVDAAYAGWPERLYLVDVDGTLVYRGDKGPGGFHPEELGKVLEELASFYAR